MEITIADRVTPGTTQGTSPENELWTENGQTNLFNLSVPEHRRQLRLFFDAKKTLTPVRMADMDFTLDEAKQLGNILLRGSAKIEEENSTYRHTWIF